MEQSSCTTWAPRTAVPGTEKLFADWKFNTESPALLPGPTECPVLLYPVLGRLNFERSDSAITPTAHEMRAVPLFEGRLLASTCAIDHPGPQAVSHWTPPAHFRRRGLSKTDISQTLSGKLVSPDSVRKNARQCLAFSRHRGQSCRHPRKRPRVRERTGANLSPSSLFPRLNDRSRLQVDHENLLRQALVFTPVIIG